MLNKYLIFLVVFILCLCFFLFSRFGPFTFTMPATSGTPGITDLKHALESDLLEKQRITLQTETYNTISEKLFSITANPLCEVYPPDLETLVNSEIIGNDQVMIFLAECLHVILSSEKDTPLKTVLTLIQNSDFRPLESKMKESYKMRLLSVLTAYLRKNINLISNSEKRSLIEKSISQYETHIESLIQRYIEKYVNYTRPNSFIANCDLHWGIAPLMINSKKFSTYDGGLTSILDRAYKIIHRQLPLGPIQLSDLSYCLQADVDKHDVFNKTYQYQLTSSILDKIVKWNGATKDLKVCGKEVGFIQIYDPFIFNQKDDSDLCKLSAPTFESNFRMYHFLNRLED